MTEKEILWQELENAMPKKKKEEQEDKPSTCSFCKKKTKKLIHETVGGINIYLCQNCMGVLEHTRKKLSEE